MTQGVPRSIFKGGGQPGSAEERIQRLVATRKAQAQQDRAQAHEFGLALRRARVVETHKNAESFFQVLRSTTAPPDPIVPGPSAAPKQKTAGSIFGKNHGKPQSPVPTVTSDPVPSEADRASPGVDDSAVAAASSVTDEDLAAAEAEVAAERRRIEREFDAAIALAKAAIGAKTAPTRVATTAHQPLPEVFSPAQWENMIERKEWWAINVKSDELQAVSAALSEYHAAFQSAPVESRHDGNRVLGDKYNTLLGKVRAWYSKETKAKKGDTWQDAPRAKAMLALTDILQPWEPPPPAKLRDTRDLEVARQDLFKELFTKRKIKSRLVDDLKKMAKDKAKKEAEALKERVEDEARALRDELREEIQMVWAQIQRVNRAVKDFARKEYQELKSFAQSLMSALTSWFQAMIRDLEALLPSLPDIRGLLAHLIDVLELLLDTLVSDAEKLAKDATMLLVDTWRHLMSKLLPVLARVLAALRSLVPSLPDIDWRALFALFRIDLPWPIPVPDLRALIAEVVAYVEQQAAALIAPLRKIAGEVRDFADAAIAVVEKDAKLVASLVGEVGAKVKEGLSAARRMILRLVKKVFTFIANLIESVASQISELWARIQALLSKFVALVKAAGKALSHALSALLQILFGVDLFTMLIELVPYVGSVSAIISCGKGWVAVYKAQKKKKTVQKAQLAFDQGEITQTLYRQLLTQVSDDVKDAATAAIASTAYSLGKLVVDAFCPAASPLVGLAKAAVVLGVGFASFMEQWQEVRETNALLKRLSTPPAVDTRRANQADQRIEASDDVSLALLNQSPLLSAYMLCLTPDRLLLNYEYLSSTNSKREDTSRRIARLLGLSDQALYRNEMKARTERIQECKEIARGIIETSKWKIPELEEYALGTKERGEETIFRKLVDKVIEKALDEGKSRAVDLASDQAHDLASRYAGGHEQLADRAMDEIFGRLSGDDEEEDEFAYQDQFDAAGELLGAAGVA